MHRPALARLYRPRRFSEIVGQDHVSRTLRTGVERGRVAHAYLFCGPRGVGKTTAARVLAMALNCEKRRDGEPCGECESCERIWSGRTSLDVVEIDAASNRGVDDARDLRERAMYAPSEESRYKVYIIDEAHMLTREAWNAFLKILEEPPPRVIFVLATTEPGKILQAAPPILSRCQRFDFHRISMQRIIDRLGTVLEKEQVEADEAALVSISRKADGALRDALSALDQVLAFSDDRVTAEDVRQVLGLVDEDLFFELFEIVADRRATEVFPFVERLVAEGYDLEEFYRGLGASLRTLMRVSLEGTGALEFVSEDLAQRYSEYAGRFAPGDLLRMLSALGELDTDGRFRKSEQQQLLIEVMLLKFAMLDRTVELEDLLDAAGGQGIGPGGEVKRRGRDRKPRSRDSKARAVAPEPAGRDPKAERRSGAVEPDEPDGGPGESDGGGRSSTAPAADTEDSSPEAAAREAWLGMIADGRVLKPGHGIALRAARVVGLAPDGALQVSVPGDTPAAELLADRVVRRRIDEELSRRLGRPIQVSRVTEEGASRPVDEETHRRQRLDQLVDGNPGLRTAVEKLDLELMD